MKLKLRTKQQPDSDQYVNSVTSLETDIISPIRDAGKLVLETTEGNQRSLRISELITLEIIVEQKDNLEAERVKEKIAEALAIRNENITFTVATEN